ncbi:Asp-tRNA(Asn)/Glu-tRNA(Gln) amidotransferase subunit GatA [Chlamydiia bacterium]|nr:Asp-tRNA(Asn)/Glu-tRNA(Gln) amidotransferase subunit GatA [Chlamydiia bacterium]
MNQINIYSSATDISSAILEQKITAEAVVKLFLRQCEETNEALNACLAIYTNDAIAEAKKMDMAIQRGENPGRLAGVPVIVKANICQKGRETNCASAILDGYNSPFDATVVSAIKREGGIIIATANMDEFAMGSTGRYSAFSPTLNPWNSNNVPGGSSSGSAAAVAARMAPISLGSDTGGSVRQPACFCGTYGLKPSYGSVSRYGLVSFASSLDQIGPMANSIEDIDLCMSVISKHCSKDATSIQNYQYDNTNSDSNSLKSIGIPIDVIRKLPDDVRIPFEHRIDQLKKSGINIIDVTMDTLQYAISTYYIISSAEASTNLSRYDGVRYGCREDNVTSMKEMMMKTRGNGFGPEVKKRIMIGTFSLSSGYIDAYYNKAQTVRDLIREEMETILTRCDIICIPTTPSSAFRIGQHRSEQEIYMEDILTVPASLSGLPAISVPCKDNNQSLPTALQLIGRFKEDKQLIEHVKQVESIIGKQKLIPSELNGGTK